MPNQLDQFITDFNNSANGAKGLLENMLTSISGGTVPEQERVKELDDCIAGLRKQYKTIRQYVSAQIPAEEMPADGSPVQALADAYEQSEAAKYKRILTHAQETLESFISVRSLIDAYASALAPYQTQANEILQKISNGETVPGDDLTAAVAGPTVFLDAIQCEDFDTDESIERLDALAEYYPPRVQTGVAGKKYFLELRETAAEKPAENKNKNPMADDAPIEAAENHDVLSHVVQSVPELPEDGELTDMADQQDTQAEQPAQDIEDGDSEEYDEEVALCVKYLDKYGAIIQSDDEFGTVTEEISPSETKKSTSGTFIGDMKKGYVPAEGLIIEIGVNRLICFNERLCPGLPPMISQDVIDNAIEYMLKKGYLRKYSLTPGGYFYCASPRLQKALALKTVSNFFRIKQFSMKNGEVTNEYTPAMIANRVAFTNLRTELYEIISEYDTLQLKQSCSFTQDSFIYEVCAEQKTFVLALGLFWTDSTPAHELHKFINSLRTYIGQNKDIEILIAAGLTYQHAKANSSAIFDFAGKEIGVKGDNIYYYSLTDNQLYSNDEQPTHVLEFDDMQKNADTKSASSAGTEAAATEAGGTNKPAEEQPANPIDDPKGNADNGAESSAEDTKKEGVKSRTQPKKAKNSVRTRKKTAEQTAKDAEINPDTPEAADTLQANEEIWDTVPEETSADVPAPVDTVSTLTDTKAEESTEKKEAEEAAGDIEEAAATPDTDADKAHVSENTALAILPPNEQKDFQAIYAMLVKGKFYAAAAYAKAARITSSEGQQMRSLIAYAVNDPMERCAYSSDNVYGMIAQRTASEDALIIAAAIRVFFSDQTQYDYNIRSFYNAIKDYPLLDRCPQLSKVLYMLMDFKDEQKRGADAYALYHEKSRMQMEKELALLQNEASDFYEKHIAGWNKETTANRRFFETKRLMLSENSAIGTFMQSVASGNRAAVAEIVEFLQANFLKDGEPLSEDSIDRDKQWAYIEGFWDAACENLMCVRRVKLMSNLRNNAISITTKAVQIFIKWCLLVDLFDIHTEDNGRRHYKKISKVLAENVAGAIDEVSTVSEANDVPVDEAGAYAALKNTLDILARCIDGTYSEFERTYFYAPFLLTDDVMLDEAYMPDLDVFEPVTPSLLPTRRIAEHVLWVQDGGSYEERLETILGGHGDDYGTAELIINYLKHLNPEKNYDEYAIAAASSKNYARTMAKLRKKDFAGELELEQMRGQMNNPTKKNEILQAVDEWYEWAEETSNYGFFVRVADCYIRDIQNAAKEKEPYIQKRLDEFRQWEAPGISPEIKEKRIEKIEQMIEAQEYTIAEDLISRAGRPADETWASREDDFLKDFLDNYDDYYKPVAMRKSSFANIIGSRMRNSEDPGIKKLATNWLPGGGSLGRDRLEGLLESFGFSINAIKLQPAVGKLENYIVTTLPDAGKVPGQKQCPIAAFGSDAVKDGFRVICVNDACDADALIDIMKQAGGEHHTLILLDHALSKGERRRLARETKRMKSEKFFGVIDRTVMMFLVKNYDEVNMKDMLLSLVMPFGYYQPYMTGELPIEMFAGRSYELEQLGTPEGANFVCGAHRMGKTSLLKRAAYDLDQTDDGKIAVYIDIKGLDHEKAVRKISRELYARGVLDTDVPTWEDLADAVRSRLQAKNSVIKVLNLFMDEGDAFVESCANIRYGPLYSLKKLQDEMPDKFSFAIAELRDIIRFRREEDAANGITAPDLRAIALLPFRPSDALELVEPPMRYLGLRIPKEQRSLLMLIFVAANHYPAVIQMFCAKLVEAMGNEDYAGYNEIDSPVYELNESHLKKALADPELAEQVREAFSHTLRPGTEKYYYLIALIMAYEYHNHGENGGYSAEDVMGIAKEYDIKDITKLSITQLRDIMDELWGLNILRAVDDEHDLFAQDMFFRMMGTKSEVDDKLLNALDN